MGEKANNYLKTIIVLLMPLLIFAGVMIIEAERLFGSISNSDAENSDVVMKLAQQSFEAQIQKFQEDTYNQAIAKSCSTPGDDSYPRLKCVTDSLKSLDIKYKQHYFPETYYTTTEAIKKGWVCRDYSINLCSIVRLMNQSCYVMRTNNHAVSLISWNLDHCIADIKGALYCW